MDPPQTEQTEKLIEEMLDFLESTSEDEETLLPDIRKPHAATSPRNHYAFNGNESNKNNSKSGHDMKKERKSKSSFGKELRKLKEEFPIWNTQEIFPNNKTSHSLPPSPTVVEEPIWRSESALDLANKSAGSSEEYVTDKGDCNEWHKRNETKSLHDDDDVYVQEVHKAIYGDTQGHPIIGSTEYLEAAQNYAVYGKDFYDFPENLDKIISGDRGNRSEENGNAGNNQFMAVEGMQSANGNEAFNPNNFGKLSNTIASPALTTSTTAAPTVAAVASTAAYYQLCNGMQQRPGPSNSGTGSATYGMFLGNKVTYMAAAPTAPTLLYNQQTATTANFVSNSLANAALATSPTILYSNPMLNATTQQYLNAFFKEAQLLSSVGNSTQANTSTAFYERLVYAQMLQQQIYHQNQQAAAVAAMIQHKQRFNAAAAAAAVSAAAAAARQTSGATANVTNTNVSNGLQSSLPNASTAISSVATSSIPAFSTLNLCGRQSSMVANNASDLIAMKQQGNTATNQPPTIAINGCEKSSNGIKE